MHNQPVYLKGMVKAPNHTRDFRSSDQNVLPAPWIKTKMGDGSFSAAALNYLLCEIRTYK